MSENQLSLYKISSEYVKYLHAFDYRVSVKYNNRPFVGIITMINDKKYVLPLTSQTTDKRIKEGKRKRANEITTFVRDIKGNEIANILHNDMFPVVEGTYTLMDIDATTNTFESNEIRYIRKHADEIILKAQKVYARRIEGRNQFLVKTCCDFKKLESKSEEYI